MSATAAAANGTDQPPQMPRNGSYPRISHNQSRTVLVPKTYLIAVALRFHEHSRSTATSTMSKGKALEMPTHLPDSSRNLSQERDISAHGADVWLLATAGHPSAFLLHKWFTGQLGQDEAQVWGACSTSRSPQA